MRNRDMNVRSGSLSRLLAAFAIAGAVATYGCGSEGSSQCFSPSGNLETAYTAGSVGCSCETGKDKDVCVADKNGRGVALICQSNRWIAVQDGPCAP